MVLRSADQAIQSFQYSLDQLIETVKGLPEETIRWNPSNDEWSIMQILCHVLEATPYWIGEISQIKRDPNLEWGRGLKDEARLSGVSHTEKRSVDDVVKELDELKYQVECELSLLDDSTLAIEAPSRNPNFGVKTISFIVDHLIVGHID